MPSQPTTPSQPTIESILALLRSQRSEIDTRDHLIRSSAEWTESTIRLERINARIMRTTSGLNGDSQSGDR